MTATETAAAVRSGATSASSLADASLAAIEARDAELHCFLHVQPDEVRRRAAEIDATVAAGRDPGPLAGVPVALKDNLCTLGTPTSCGSKLLERWAPPYDATVVERLELAGAVVIGKTNLDEFAMGSSTENSAFGPTRNPLDPTRVPGGSSGGSAAAVAAGFVSLALGSDTGGSIRQPASFCGVVGLKPTYGLVSRYGLVAFASSLDQIGPIALDVADAALLLEVIAGHDPRDSTSLPDPPPSYRDALAAGVEGLRLAVVDELTEPVSPECAAAVSHAAASLASAGATVEHVSLPEVVLGLPAYYLIAPAEASSNLSRYDGVRYGLRVDGDDVEAMNTATRTAGFGSEVKRRIMLGTYALSAGYYDAFYGQAQRVRTLICRAFDSAYGRFDALIAATTPTVAFRLGEHTADPLSMYLSDVCTVASNLAGHPAISVPYTVDPGGLPTGVQVLAPALGERVLLSVAAALEAMRP